MSISYNGFNENSATFEIGGDVFRGDVVKMSANSKVSPCGAGDDFCGIVANKEQDNCGAIQLSGVVDCMYSGTAPKVGYCNLVADSAGGVKVATTDGRPHLVVYVDTTFKIIEFLL